MNNDLDYASKESKASENSSIESYLRRQGQAEQSNQKLEGQDNNKTVNEINRLPVESWMIELWQWADNFNIHDSSIPRDKEALTALESLYLNIYDISVVTEFDELPKAIFNLSNLKHLTIHCDKLSRIPDDVKKLQKLETLDIKSNQLKNVNSNISYLKSLKKLSLVCPNLEAIPHSIEELDSLSFLNVQSQNIPHLQTYLPENLVQRFQDKKLGILGIPYCHFFSPKVDYCLLTNTVLINLSDEWTEEQLSHLKYQSGADLLIALQTKGVQQSVSVTNLEDVDCIISCRAEDIDDIEAMLNYDPTSSSALDYFDLYSFLLNKSLSYCSEDVSTSSVELQLESVHQATQNIIERLPSSIKGLLIQVEYSGELNLEDLATMWEVIQCYKIDEANVFINISLLDKPNHFVIKTLYYID